MNSINLRQKLTQLQQISAEITALLLQEDYQLAIVDRSNMKFLPINNYSFTTEVQAFVNDYKVKEGSIPYLVSGFDSQNNFVAGLIYNLAQIEATEEPPEDFPF